MQHQADAVGAGQVELSERDEVRQVLREIALGEAGGTGRELAARMSAARRWELMTRPTDERPPEEVQQTETRDYPCDHEGSFYPGARPELWALKLNWRWQRGSQQEAEAVERWRRTTSHVHWELQGRPWAHSDWEQDPAAWHEALAAYPALDRQA